MKKLNSTLFVLAMTIILSFVCSCGNNSETFPIESEEITEESAKEGKEETETAKEEKEPTTKKEDNKKEESKKDESKEEETKKSETKNKSDIEKESEPKEENKAEATTKATDTKETKTDNSNKAAESTPAPTTAPVHTHNYNGIVTKEANCASNGTKTYTCSCGDSYTESIAANGNHNWKEIYGTVEHASQGEMRQVQVGTSGDVYVCNYCGAEYGSSPDVMNHYRGYVGSDNMHATTSYSIRSGGPVYENQWVVTSEAWTETVVTGYQCTTCGATK